MLKLMIFVMKKKIVFVTGGNRGIGKGIVKELLKKDYNVVIGYKNTKKGIEILTNKNSFAVQVDISNRYSIKKAIKKTENKFGTIDILINNAAISQEKPFEKISDSDWNMMMDVNLRGPFSFSQEVIEKMKIKKWGRIINIASIGGQWGGYNQVHYAVSKAGMINLTRSLAKIYSKNRITINSISPGLVKTDMSKKEISSTKGKKKIDLIPIGRIGNIEEIAKVVVFLCSEDSSYITGQTINVNGGMFFN